MSNSRPPGRLGSALVLCAGIALGQPKGPSTIQKAAPVPPGCASSIVVPDSSFTALSGGGLRDVSVWVDDVDSGLSGRFDPFEVYVVTGRVSAPFTLKAGTLSRDAFVKFTGGNYNTMVDGPIVVSRGTRQGQRTVSRNGRAFTVKVLGVQAAAFSRDTVTIQLCW